MLRRKNGGRKIHLVLVLNCWSRKWGVEYNAVGERRWKCHDENETQWRNSFKPLKSTTLLINLVVEWQKFFWKTNKKHITELNNLTWTFEFWELFDSSLMLKIVGGIRSENVLLQKGAKVTVAKVIVIYRNDKVTTIKWQQKI